MTPNQIREREEHERALQDRWGGKMPDGEKCPKKVGGFIVASHRHKGATQFTDGQPSVNSHRWKDMGTERLYPLICEKCGVKFHHETKSTKQCLGCRGARKHVAQ